MVFVLVGEEIGFVCIGWVGVEFDVVFGDY